MLGSPCEGCQYHSFPYSAEIPVLINGKREKRTFRCKEDVLAVVDLIVDETKQFNEREGKSFDITQSVIAQMPFFACNNVFFDNEIQKDIQRYIYCEKFGTPPYKGSYGEQPARWVARAFGIKAALAKKEKKEIDNVRQNSNKV